MFLSFKMKRISNKFVLDIPNKMQQSIFIHPYCSRKELLALEFWVLSLGLVLKYVSDTTFIAHVNPSVNPSSNFSKLTFQFFLACQKSLERLFNIFLTPRQLELA